MKSERQRLQSTKLPTKTKEQTILQDYFPTSDLPNEKINEVCYALIDIEKESIGYMDLTGHFTKWLAWGNKYIFVAYYFNRNYICSNLVKNRKGSSITAA